MLCFGITLGLTIDKNEKTNHSEIYRGGSKMKKLFVCLVFLLVVLQFVLAENTIVRTEFDVKITPHNQSCAVEINTEDDDFDYDVNETSSYNGEEIAFVRDLKCKDERYFENMTNICTSLISQYEVLLPNIRLVDEFAHMSGDYKSCVDMRDKTQNDLVAMTTKSDECVNSRLTRADCDVEKELDKKGWITENACNAKGDEIRKELRFAQIIVGMAIGFGIAWWQRGKDIKGPTKGLEDFETKARYRKL